MTTAEARRLRANMTKAEVRLWLQLKALRAEGFHFRRQAPFDAFYLDFVCHAQKLVIELDDGHHAEDAQSEHDRVRDAILRRRGYRVLRFWNRELDRNMSGVMTMILDALHEDFPTLTASPSVPPREGEG